MSIRILVADDHEVVRLGLRRLLAKTEIKIIGEAADGHQAIEMALKLKPDLVLLDVRMPEGGGLRALGVLKERHPDMPVLMFSGFDNPNFAARSLALGASGYVLKRTPRKKLVSAIRKAAKGEAVWGRAELRGVSGALTSPRMPVDVEVPLTDRESEILQLMAEGLTNREIARHLSISDQTVKEHVQHIFRKLGVADRTQAAIWAVRNDVA